MKEINLFPNKRNIKSFKKSMLGIDFSIDHGLQVKDIVLMNDTKWIVVKATSGSITCKPYRISLFQRFINWIKSLFIYL